MSQLNKEKVHVFFGDSQHAVPLNDIKQLRYSNIIEDIVRAQGLSRLVVLDQVHGNQGFAVDDAFLSSQQHWFDHQGDFLVTNQKNIALIVLTADCVPVVIHDPINQAIGIVHSGWKGSYLGVLQEALILMQKTYSSHVQNLVCEFGPSAKGCCYEVSKEFQDNFEKQHEISSLFFEKRDSKMYFDNDLFLQEMLKKFGIPVQNIYTSNALCTICNLKFCSFRKDKEQALRQITLVALR